jgi:ribosomal protein S18 acetylase RimI-like enzyme
LVGVLEPARGLSASALDAIAELEREVIAADGGRLKLEWGTLRSRPGDRVEDLLWWDDGRLLGFLGIYAFGAPTAELTGMVHPQARRRGIATALLDAALAICREREYPKTLLVTPRTPPAARELALGRGAVLDHSEYALQLTGAPAGAPVDPRITLRPMNSGDAPAVSALLREGFGWEEPEAPSLDRAGRDLAETVMVELDGAVVGSVRVTRDDDRAGVYGFVIHPDHRGRGIGRDVLHRISVQALAEGAARVHLEVAVDNPRALGLYTSLGFAPIATEDYYALRDGALAQRQPSRVGERVSLRHIYDRM